MVIILMEERKKMRNLILKSNYFILLFILVIYFSFLGVANAGNYGSGIYGAFLYSASDTTNPTVTAFVIPSTSSSLAVSISSFTASDNQAVTGYLLTETSSTPSAGLGTWTGSAPTTYTFATAGSKILYAWAKDAAGNVSSSLNDSVVITLPDITSPTVTAFVIPATSSSLVVSVSSFTATDNLAVTGYLLTETSSTPSAGLGTWTTPAPTTYTFATAGSKTLYAWAKDAAGNVSSSLNDSVNITLPDITSPTVTAFVIPSTSTSLVVSVSSFTASDNTAVTGYLLTETSSTPSAGLGTWTGSAPTTYTFATAGSKTLYAWAKDAAGNVSSSLNDSVVITLPEDNTKPVVTAFSIPSTSTTLIVSISTFTATDANGVIGYKITESSNAPLAGDSGWTLNTPTTYTFSSIGEKILYAWAKDSAGNISDSLNDSVIITLPSSNGGSSGSYKPTFVSNQIPNTVVNNTNDINLDILLIKSVLKYGMTNIEVKKLQIFLNNHNYPIALLGMGSLNNETTYFGSLTKKAVIKFQLANGLVGDGIVGEMTRSIINKLISSSVKPVVPVINTPILKLNSILKFGSKGDEVIELQKLLKEKGYFNLELNSNFGPATKSAVIKFQLANGLVGDGIVGEMTWVLLK